MATQAVKVEVVPVRRRRELTAFIRQPYAIYASDPHWVKPLEKQLRDQLDKSRNPFFEFADMELFLAYRDGVPAGRIAAIYNPRFIGAWRERVGFFGFFECADCPDVASALFASAGDWLRKRGVAVLQGPVSPSANYECGLLVDGFDGPHTLLTGHHPRYYQNLLEGLGFTKAKDLWSWRSPDGPEPPGRVARVDAAVRRRGVTVRTIDFRRWDREVSILRELYNEAWKDNWGFVPMTEAEFGEMARQLRPLSRRELTLIAEVNGIPAGFALSIPDLNQAIRAANGRLTPWGLLRMWSASRRVRRGRLVALGVVERFRGIGVEVALYAETLRAIRRIGLDGENEVSWTLEDNDRIHHCIKAMGCERTRTHRLYEIPLSDLR